MISDIDIWRCADELIKQYGDQADIEAAAPHRHLQRVWAAHLKPIDAHQGDPAGGIVR